LLVSAAVNEPDAPEYTHPDMAALVALARHGLPLIAIAQPNTDPCSLLQLPAAVTPAAAAAAAANGSTSSSSSSSSSRSVPLSQLVVTCDPQSNRITSVIVPWWMLSTAGDISVSYTTDNWRLPAGGFSHLQELWITAEPWQATLLLPDEVSSQTGGGSSSRSGKQPSIFLPAPQGSSSSSSSSSADACIPYAPALPLPEWLLPWLAPALRHLTVGAAPEDTKDLKSWRSNALLPQQLLWQLRLQALQLDDVVQMLLGLLPQESAGAMQRAVQMVQQLQQFVQEVEGVLLFQQDLDMEPLWQQAQQLLHQDMQDMRRVLDEQQQQIDEDQQQLYRLQVLQNRGEQQAPEQSVTLLGAVLTRHEECMGIREKIQQLQNQQGQLQARLQQQQQQPWQQQQTHSSQSNSSTSGRKQGAYERSQHEHWPFSSWRESGREHRAWPFTRLGLESAAASGPLSGLSGYASGPAWRMDVYQPDGISRLAELVLLKSLRISPLTEMPAAARKLLQLVQQQGNCPSCSSSSSSSYAKGKWLYPSYATHYLLPGWLGSLKNLEVLELQHATELPMELPRQWSELARLQLLSITHSGPCRPQVWPPSFIGSSMAQHDSATAAGAGSGRQLSEQEQQQLAAGCGLASSSSSSSTSSCRASNLLMCQYARQRFACSCTTATANALAGTLPEDWQALTSLRALNLPGHNLTGTLPAGYAFGVLPAAGLGDDGMWLLQHLSLRANRLSSSIPAAYVWDPNDDSVFSYSDTGYPILEVLDLDCNWLEGGLPRIDRLPQLRVMSAASNRLTGSVPVKLPATLEVLDLHHNDLTGPVPCFTIGSGLSVSSSGESSSDKKGSEVENAAAAAAGVSAADEYHGDAGAPATYHSSSSKGSNGDSTDSGMYVKDSNNRDGEQELLLQLVILADNR
jgi:hypothetical protein